MLKTEYDDWDARLEAEKTEWSERRAAAGIAAGVVERSSNEKRSSPSTAAAPSQTHRPNILSSVKLSAASVLFAQTPSVEDEKVNSEKDAEAEKIDKTEKDSFQLDEEGKNIYFNNSSVRKISESDDSLGFENSKPSHVMSNVVESKEQFYDVSTTPVTTTTTVASTWSSFLGLNFLLLPSLAPGTAKPNIYLINVKHFLILYLLQ
jgi:hypothetical protein